MPLILLIAGILFLAAAIRGKQALLFNTLKSDFTGPNNFIIWAVALIVIASVGSVKAMRPLSNAFMCLVILVIIIANYKGGHNIFQMFMEQIGASQAQAVTSTNAPSNPAANGGGSNAGNGGGGASANDIVGNVVGIGTDVATMPLNPVGSVVDIGRRVIGFFGG